MIKGDRVTLRAIERDDLPRYVAWLNDSEVTHIERPYGFSMGRRKNVRRSGNL